MNVPNAITAIRILLVPVLVFLLVNGSFGAATWLVLAAGMSDALDGFIAKRFNQCTSLGAMLDPLADKLLVVAAVGVLTWLGYLPWWLTGTIVVRDIVIIGGAYAFYSRFGRFEIAPSLPSKLNTFIQIGLIFLILCQLSELVQIARWLSLLIAVAFLSATVSGVHYVVVWGRKAAGLPA